MPNGMTSMSITQHFQFLADCAHALQHFIQSNVDFSSNQTLHIYQTTFADMAAIGVKIEKHSAPYKLQADTQLIENIAQAFGPKKTIPYIGKPSETLDYHLPTITEAGTFIAVCCYLKYAKNYQKVTYKGDIEFFVFKSKIDAGVEKNKPRFNSKACFIEKEIRNYCKKNKIPSVDVFKSIEQAVNGRLVDDLSQLLKAHASNENVSDTALPMLSVDDARQAYIDAHHAHSFYVTKFQELQTLEKHISTLNKRTSGSLGKKYRAFFDANSDEAKLIKANAMLKQLQSELTNRSYGVEPKEYLQTLAAEERNALVLCDQAIARRHGL